MDRLRETAPSESTWPNFPTLSGFHSSLASQVQPAGSKIESKSEIDSAGNWILPEISGNKERSEEKIVRFARYLTAKVISDRLKRYTPDIWT